ncbi:MAG: tetratricopeptide repeat protein [Pseudomonadota bacterium]
MLSLLAGGARAAPSDEGDEQALGADADYAAGLAALKTDDYPRALPHFLNALKRFPDAANLHNELGYTLRKLGRLDKAFEHYKRALAIDPRHRGAHEYIGEAYLMQGDVASAEKHLEALRSICTLPCDEMRDLQAAIDTHRRRAPAR